MRAFLILIGLIGSMYFCELLSQDATTIDTSSILAPIEILALKEIVIINNVNDFHKEDEHKTDFVQSLLFQSPIHIHTSSPGMLSTAKYGGSSSGHTAILWEGLNIQSATNGSLDLSLLSTNLFNQASYIRTGYNIMANGGISGAILLDNKYGREKMIGFAISSDKNISIQTKNYKSIGKFYLQLNANYDIQENQYRYVKNKANYLLNGETSIQNEAKLEGYNVVSSINYRPNTAQLWTLNFWLQKYERNISPSKVSSSTQATQTDNNTRLQLSHRYKINNAKKWSVKSQLAYFNEYLRYQSDIISPSISRVHSIIWNESIDIKPTTKSQWTLNGAIRDDISVSNFFTETKTRIDASINIAHQYLIHDRTYIYSSIRINSHQWDAPVINANIGYEIGFNNDLNLKISINRNHKYPNLNDLYWPVLGNPDLKRELAHVIYFDLQQDYKLNELNFSLGLHLHESYLRDKINWSPGKDGLWRPNNIGSVLLYGVDLDIKLEFPKTYQIKGVSIFYLNHNISQIYDDIHKNVIGKELTYNPRYKLSNISKVGLYNYNLQLETLYIGERFTSSDNKYTSPAYWIQNLSFQKNIEWKSYKENDKKNILIYFDINNLWNTDYESIPYFATPLRHYKIGIKYHY